MNKITKTLGIALFVFTVGGLLTASGAAWAKSAHSLNTSEGPDPTAVTTCGTYNGTDTIYYLTGNIVTVSTGNCIILSGSNDALLLNGYTITGPGSSSSTGAGIKITGNTNVIEGFNAIVSGFGTGPRMPAATLLRTILTSR
jgi:hypothetical protein